MTARTFEISVQVVVTVVAFGSFLVARRALKETRSLNLRAQLAEAPILIPGIRTVDEEEERRLMKQGHWAITVEKPDLDHGITGLLVAVRNATAHPAMAVNVFVRTHEANEGGRFYESRSWRETLEPVIDPEEAMPGRGVRLFTLARSNLERAGGQLAERYGEDMAGHVMERFKDEGESIGVLFEDAGRSLYLVRRSFKFALVNGVRKPNYGRTESFLTGPVEQPEPVP